MTMLLFCLLFLTAILFLYEWSKNVAINKEILYVKERIAEISCENVNGYILIPSKNQKVKELVAQINRSYDIFYAQKTEYERSKRAMTQTLTNISHDLRTPLTVLKGYIEWMNKEIKEIPETEHIKDMVAKMDGKANEFILTINEYFTMSKIASGDMYMKLQETNITEVCHEVILDYYDTLEKLNFEVAIDIGGLPEYAYADTDALKRILKDTFMPFGRLMKS